MITVEGSPRQRGMMPALISPFMDPAMADRITKSLNGGRRFNLAMREPGWIDADPPTWEWELSR